VARLFERVTIAGVGLIGGSLALAARRAGTIGEVVGFGRSLANLELAQRLGIIDRFHQDPVAAAQGADLLLLSVPVGSLAAVAQACAPSLALRAIVSDVGSVKASVVRDVEAVLPDGIRFVGAHPIAGTESSGAAAAQVDLFVGRRCVLTPGPTADSAATSKIRALWESVGMQVDEMGAAQHDEMLACVSHLPHVIAFGLVNAILDRDPSMAAFAGPSFGDMTRIAASEPATWRDIFLANRGPILQAIDSFLAQLTVLRAAVDGGDAAKIEATIAKACGARRAWSGDV